MDFTKEIKEVLEPMAKDISDICKINSVESEPLEGMPFGEGPAKALQAALDIGKRMGFETENFDNYVGHVDFGDGEDMIGILGHVDVVPAGEGWEHDPWGGEISDGYIWGRGTVDDKGPMIVCLYALKILKDKGVKLNKKVRMIFGTNEETNWGCMNYYLNNVKPKFPSASFSPDASFPVTYAEKGIYQFNLIKNINTNITVSGGNAFNAVPSIAEALVPSVNKDDVLSVIPSLETKCTFTVTECDGKVKITSLGKGGHAAELQEGINAVSGLMELLSKLNLNDEISEVLKFYENKIGNTIYAEKLGIANEDESGHLTLNIGKISIENNKAVISCDIRIPVTDNLDRVRNFVKTVAQENGFIYEECAAETPLYIPKDSPLVTTLMDAYKDITGDVTAVPITSGGGTYSRTINNCVAFGCILPDQEDTIHQANERLKLEHMEKWLEIYIEAIYRLAK